MKSKNNIDMVAGDLGQGGNKIVSRYGSTRMPSFVGTPTGKRIAATRGVKKSSGSLLIEHDGNAFYVGENAHNDGRPLESVDYDRLLGSPEIKAILFGALTQHSESYNDVHLMLGLPLALLGEDNKHDTDRKIKKWLTGEHHWIANGVERSINIVKVGIVSQPTGAMFDFVYGEGGSVNKANYNIVKGEIAMLSIGFYTIEMQVLNGGKITQRLSGSTENGVHRLLNLANEDGAYSLGELDAMLRRGALDTSGILDTWSRMVTGDIDREWGEKGRWKKFGRILTVGGGIHVLNGHLSKYQVKAHVPDDPVMSIANGIYKYMLSKAK